MHLSDDLSKPAWLFKNSISPWGWVLVGCLGAMFVFMLIPYGLFPHRHEKGLQSHCMSNEKQIGLSFLGYAQDYDEYLPPADKWMDATQPYAKSKEIYHCPSVNDDKTEPSYAFDDRLSSKRKADLKNAAQTMVVYDSTKNVRNAHDAGTSLPVPGRHASGNDIAYADGHVKWRKDAGNP